MIKIKIPATSANIGSGFDCLGVAVTLYNEIHMEESDHVHIQSLDGIEIPTDRNNLIYKTANYLYDLCGKKLSGLHIQQINSIPLARGLGSSSACIVGGLLGANHLMGNPLKQDEIVNIAANMEGHPDNSTPALLGGIVTAAIDNGKVYYVKQEVKEDIQFVAFIPSFELKTSHARSVIPKEINHKDGVFNLSRAALMSVSLANGHYENLRVACEDKLHQPYRLQLIPKAGDVFKMSYELGAYAVYISGAGSTLMAIVDKSNNAFLEKAKEGLAQMGLSAWKTVMLNPDNRGTVIER